MYDICFILKIERATLNLFYGRGKLSTNLFEHININLWSSLKSATSGYNISTFVNTVQTKYPKSSKDQKDIPIDEIPIPTIVCEKHDSTTYECEETYHTSVSRFSETNHTIVLKCHLCTGKSTCICDLIKRPPSNNQTTNGRYDSVVCIHPRVMFTNNILIIKKRCIVDLSYRRNADKLPNK